MSTTTATEFDWADRTAEVRAMAQAAGMSWDPFMDQTDDGWPVCVLPVPEVPEEAPAEPQVSVVLTPPAPVEPAPASSPDPIQGEDRTRCSGPSPIRPPGVVPLVQASRHGGVARDARAPRRRRKENLNGPSSLPRTGLETEPATDQNQHLWTIISKVKGTTQHVGVVANALIGAEAKKAGGFGKVSRDLTAEYLAARTGLSPNACRTHMGKLVKAGFFVREDWARGGRGGKGRAEYRATMPVYEE